MPTRNKNIDFPLEKWLYYFLRSIFYLEMKNGGNYYEPNKKHFYVNAYVTTFPPYLNSGTTGFRRRY
jgi:hypothetical protein